jgi:hypothetical protein
LHGRDLPSREYTSVSRVDPAFDYDEFDDELRSLSLKRVEMASLYDELVILRELAADEGELRACGKSSI